MCVLGGKGCIWELSILFAQFFCELKIKSSPGQCGTVVALSHKLEDRGFGSQLGHLPVFWVWSPFGVQRRGN